MRADGFFGEGAHAGATYAFSREMRLRHTAGQARIFNSPSRYSTHAAEAARDERGERGRDAAVALARA